jgi:hypothetical protein
VSADFLEISKKKGCLGQFDPDGNPEVKLGGLKLNKHAVNSHNSIYFQNFNYLYIIIVFKTKGVL